MKIEKYIGELKRIENPVKKRAFFTALLSDEVFELTGKRPIVVGGEALEIYSQGNYTTGDIDLKGDKVAIETVLRRLCFIKAKGWGQKELDLYVEWLGNGLEEGKEAEEKTRLVEIMGRNVRLISIEDLIIDRLNAAKWWGDKDSEMWASFLYRFGKEISDIDPGYLRKRAAVENVSDRLKEIEGSFKVRFSGKIGKRGR